MPYKLSRIVIGISCILCFSSCALRSNSESVTVNKGNVEINVLKAALDVRDFPLSKLVKDVEFVEFESTPQSYFSFFTSLEITDNYILIADQTEQKVLLFNRSGKFLRQIGKRGKGPGEFLNPYYATIDPNEQIIIIKDAMGGNLLSYNVEGQCQKQINIADKCPTRANAQPMFIDDDHFALSFNRPLVPTNNHYNVAIFDLNLNLIEKQIPIPNNDSLCLRNLSGQKLLQGSDGIFHWEGFVDKVHPVGFGQKANARYKLMLEENGKSLGFLTGVDMSIKGFEFNFIIDITDLPNHLLFLLYKNGLYQMIYDKKNHEAFTINDQNECITTSFKRQDLPIWDNDIFGFDKLLVVNHMPRQNIIASPIYLDEASKKELDCLKTKEVQFPQKRDQLARMIEEYTGEELPVLAIMHLKK